MHLDVGRRTNTPMWTYAAGQIQPASAIRSIGSMSFDLKYVGRIVGFWEGCFAEGYISGPFVQGNLKVRVRTWTLRLP